MKINFYVVSYLVLLFLQQTPSRADMIRLSESCTVRNFTVQPDGKKVDAPTPFVWNQNEGTASGNTEYRIGGTPESPDLRVILMAPGGNRPFHLEIIFDKPSLAKRFWKNRGRNNLGSFLGRGHFMNTFLVEHPGAQDRSKTEIAEKLKFLFEALPALPNEFKTHIAQTMHIPRPERVSVSSSSSSSPSLSPPGSIILPTTDEVQHYANQVLRSYSAEKERHHTFHYPQVHWAEDMRNNKDLQLLAGISQFALAQLILKNPELEVFLEGASQDKVRVPRQFREVFQTIFKEEEFERIYFSGQSFELPPSDDEGEEEDLSSKEKGKRLAKRDRKIERAKRRRVTPPSFKDVIKDMFPAGIPEKFADLNENQITYLAALGAPQILFHLGPLGHIHRVLEKSWADDVHARLECRGNQLGGQTVESLSDPLMATLVFDQREWYAARQARFYHHQNPDKKILVVFGKDHNLSPWFGQQGIFRLPDFQMSKPSED
jgi:hypothetical protein